MYSRLSQWPSSVYKQTLSPLAHIFLHPLIQQQTHTRSYLSPTHTEQLWKEQAVIRTVNGFSVVVNCSLHGSGGEWGGAEGRAKEGCHRRFSCNNLVFVSLPLSSFYLFLSRLWTFLVENLWETDDIKCFSDWRRISPVLLSPACCSNLFCERNSRFPHGKRTEKVIHFKNNVKLSHKGWNLIYTITWFDSVFRCQTILFQSFSLHSGSAQIEFSLFWQLMRKLASAIRNYSRFQITNAFVRQATLFEYVTNHDALCSVTLLSKPKASFYVMRFTLATILWSLLGLDRHLKGKLKRDMSINRKKLC